MIEDDTTNVVIRKEKSSNVYQVSVCTFIFFNNDHSYLKCCLLFQGEVLFGIIDRCEVEQKI